MYTDEQTKLIRWILKTKFSELKTGVRKGTGTASNWIDIRIETELDRETGKEERINLKGSIMKEIRKELKKRGTSLSTYYSDDGYNTEMECINIHWDFIK